MKTGIQSKYPLAMNKILMYVQDLKKSKIVISLIHVHVCLIEH